MCREIKSAEVWSETWTQHGNTSADIIRAIQADVLEWCHFAVKETTVGDCQTKCLAVIDKKRDELTKGVK